MPTIFAPVATARLLNPDGTASSQLLLFLNELLNRVGGPTGGIYSKINVNAGTILWDLSSAPIAVVVLANGVNTLLTPVNQVAGNLFPYRLTVIQPSSGAAGTLLWPKPPFLFPGGVTPTLSTANNAIDDLWFTSDGKNIHLCVEALNQS